MRRQKFSHDEKNHDSSNWLLIYVKDTDIKIISLSRTGTHSDLFDKKNRLKAK